MLYISASDVAAIVGKNPYKTRDDVLHKVLKIGPTPDDVAEEALRTLPPDVQVMVHQTIAESRATETSSSMAQELVARGAEIPNEVVKEYLTRKVSTQHGVNNEAKTARHFGVRSDDTFYRHQLTETVQLIGRIDGRLEEDEETIVEIKNRRNRLFNRIPEYEMVQIHVYMFLTGAQRCLFIERYNDVTKTYTVDFDEPYFTHQVLTPLTSFANNIGTV
jgi:hypothetical protein